MAQKAQKSVKSLSVYNVHAGHNPDGKKACGATGLLKESTEARAVKDKVITMLRILGKTVYDCTCENGTSQNDILKKIVAKCNAHDADIDISVHLNSGRVDPEGDGSTGGVEVWLYPGSTLVDIAEDVCKYISEELGIRNRGVKYSSALYVLKNTKASAMLIECCFVDDKDDADRFNSTKVAEGIVRAVTGVKYTYGSEQQTINQGVIDTGYLVRITAGTLNVRNGPGTSYDVVTQVKKGDVYTIVKEKNGWGQLKSGAGWISLAYTELVRSE